MSELYLITGFLGAGKTTFLRHFLPLFSGKKIRMIINEFGKEGVDGTLLQDLQAILKEITGGSVFCSCRLDQFEQALQECGEDEVILVETSGLSDPTGVRRLFSQSNRFPHISYMGCICLIDAVRFPKVYATARNCARQLAASDLVVLNKIDQASPEETSHLILGQRPDIPIIETTYGQIPENFLEILCSAQNGDRQALPLFSDLTTRRITVHLSDTISSYDLEMFIRMFAEESYRVKGFLQTHNLGIVLADCVGNVVSITPCTVQPDPQKIGFLTILSGNKTPIRSAVKKACDWYAPYVLQAD